MQALFLFTFSARKCTAPTGYLMLRENIFLA